MQGSVLHLVGMDGSLYPWVYNLKLGCTTALGFLCRLSLKSIWVLSGCILSPHRCLAFCLLLVAFAGV